MVGLVPTIHVSAAIVCKTWILATGASMTKLRSLLWQALGKRPS